MTHKDSGWRPSVGFETYGGHEIWDHGTGPHEINHGEVDGEIEFPEELERLIEELED
ncbi:hypothetical protein [Haladaptatus salinisoli]|uniref:hypothetical protein n=1 Tax=Haladaptatus salinisoli TaxID=2884876 RepID=UPI001D0A0166|nr:hypothetical protein [Haladaptatus salinisoli]